jgi:hypothetical protein
MTCMCWAATLHVVAFERGEATSVFMNETNEIKNDDAGGEVNE